MNFDGEFDSLRAQVYFYELHVMDDENTNDGEKFVDKLSRAADRLIINVREVTLEESAELEMRGTVLSPSDEQQLTALHEAIAEKSLKNVNAAIRDGANVNHCHAKLSWGFPLIHAFEAGDKRIIRTLLKAGANPNVCDLLASCVKENNLSLARLLLEFGANPNGQPTWEKDGNFETNLIRAARQGQYAFVKLLLESGADPHVRNADNESAMLIASTDGNNRLARLIKRYVSKEEYKWVEERLDDAHEDRLRLDKRIYEAIQAGGTERVLELFKDSGRPLGDLLEPERGSPLEEAMQAYFDALSETTPKDATTLADGNAKYQPDFCDPEVIARRKTASALLDLDAPVHQLGWVTPLSFLISLTGCPEDIELGMKMINKATDVDAPIRAHKGTALSSVVRAGKFGYSTVFTKALLDRGADPNAKNSYGESILQRARQCEKWHGPNPSVPLLLEAGAKD